MPDLLDAVVIGSGPNGLAAAIELARFGRRVVVFEAASAVGGGLRSAELTLSGFVHDVCSAVHPLAVASPFFKTLPLADHGLDWVEPPAMLAHPFDDGTAAVVFRSVERTAEQLNSDAGAYRQIIGRIVGDWPRIDRAVLGPLRWPEHPLTLAHFGLRALIPAEVLARRTFTSEATRGLFAGIAAHSMLPLDRVLTGGLGLILNALAHVAGWVIPRGGSQSLANALAAQLRALGGEIRTTAPIGSIAELPAARAVLCDLSPKPFLRIAGHRLPARYRRKLEGYRYGMGVCKVDWALDAPIPWRARECSLAATVHLGGTLEQIARSESDAWNGKHTEHPFTLVVQPTLFDPSRAPDGKHTALAYCHVPSGSTIDMASAIERQMERFAPGFRERVLMRHVMQPADIERHNPNFVGGDISSGATNLAQFFARPTWRTYSTPIRGLFLCSAATPPGAGVHGMCGYFAARRALASLRDW